MDTLPKQIQNELAFEQANFVNGSCKNDSFYECLDEVGSAAPGTLLKVEKHIDTSEYLLPPGTALSRFMYQSENLNGQPVPVSALIIWPYTASSFPDGHPVVAWAHGTSGVSPDCAPSHHKNIWQHFLSPYQLVLHGYVVVATDYAGLGVSKNHSDVPIIHEYLYFPSHANDIFHGVNAAQQAFEELSKSIVVIGHSQGGGAAWACAQRQAEKPVSGYLGAVAVSPATKILDEPGEFAPLLGVGTCPAVAATDPGFDIATVLSQPGLQYLDTVENLGTGLAGASALYLGAVQAGANLLKPHWKENEHIQKFQARVHNGGKAIDGPLFVVHGESDPRLSVTVVSKAVAETATKYYHAP